MTVRRPAGWRDCPQCEGAEGEPAGAGGWRDCRLCEGAGGWPAPTFEPVPAFDPGVLRQFTIYHGCADIPDAFPVRCVTIRPGSPVDYTGVLVGAPATLEEARALVPRWADTRIARSPRDAPVIVESWV